MHLLVKSYEADAKEDDDKVLKFGCDDANHTAEAQVDQRTVKYY